MQARTFAPLMLAWLIDAGDRDQDAFDAVARWYPAEPDTRGYDDQLGWLHAVAHGADYLGECARANIATGPRVLAVLAARLLGPGPAWHNQEDARIAHAALLALSGCTKEEAASWLQPVNVALDDYEQPAADGQPSVWLHNAYTTCTSLYVALAEQPRDGDKDAPVDQPDAVRAALAQTVSRMTPWLVMPST